MIRRALLALALAFACGTSAFAAPVNAVNFPVNVFPTYALGYVTTTSATSFTNTAITPGAATRPAQFLIGIQSVSATAQTGSLTCYDNPSAASGTIVALETTMGPGMQITFPFPGLPLTTGLTCISSAAVVGAFQVQYL